MAGVPELAIEVLSPSTRLIDLNLKKAAFREAGVAHYWVVDPALLSVTAWRLADGGWSQVAAVTADEVLAVTEPFPVRLCPAELVR